MSFFFSSGVLGAIPVIDVIDDFEDGDITEYGGDTGNFTVVDESNVTPSAQNGTKLLEGSVSSGAPAISSTSDLGNYPTQGDTWRIWTRSPASTGGAIARIGYFSASETAFPDGYEAQLNYANGDFILYDRASGANLDSDTTVSYNTTTWYEIEIAVTTNGDHTIRLLDASRTEKAKLTATDTTRTDGGISFSIDTDGSALTYYFDWERITG